MVSRTVCLLLGWCLEPFAYFWDGVSNRLLTFGMVSRTVCLLLEWCLEPFFLSFSLRADEWLSHTLNNAMHKKPLRPQRLRVEFTEPQLHHLADASWVADVPTRLCLCSLPETRLRRPHAKHDSWTRCSSRHKISHTLLTNSVIEPSSSWIFSCILQKS